MQQEWRPWVLGHFFMQLTCNFRACAISVLYVHLPFHDGVLVCRFHIHDLVGQTTEVMTGSSVHMVTWQPIIKHQSLLIKSQPQAKIYSLKRVFTTEDGWLSFRILRVCTVINLHGHAVGSKQHLPLFRHFRYHCISWIIQPKWQSNLQGSLI